MTFLMLVNEIVGNGLYRQLRVNKRAFSAVIQTTDIAEAKNILSGSPIDIMLCDMELFGSRDVDQNMRALSFLQWIRENSSSTMTIVLNNHSNACINRKLSQLEVFETLQKPVDSKILFNAVIRALMFHVACIRRDNIFCSPAEEEARQSRRFWHKLLRREILSDKKIIEEYINAKQLSVPTQDLFQPLLLSLGDQEEELANWDYTTLQQQVAQCIRQMPLLSTLYTAIVCHSGKTLLIIAALPREDILTVRTSLLQELSPFLKRLHERCGATFRLHFCELCEIDHVAASVEHLQFSHFFNNRVELINNVEKNTAESTISFIEAENQAVTEWRNLLNSGNFSRAQAIISTHLMFRQRQTRSSHYYLSRFNLVYISLLVECMNNHCIPPERLYDSDDRVRSAALAMHSFEEAVKWVRLSVNYLCAITSGASESAEPVEAVREYIKHHINQPIRIEEIAHSIHLNPDYLNRIFKSAMNLSIREYITQERLESAKWYLEHSTYSGSEIAALVGYVNYSSFYRAFVKYTGESPQVWKTRILQEENQNLV